MEKQISINYYGYFTPFGGYGIANINWVKHLRRIGVDVSVHAKFQPQPDSPEWDVLTPEERKMFMQPFEKRHIGIIETNPFDFHLNQSEIKIANTMCESDSVGEEWREQLNKMDYIIVPNEFCKKVFLKANVEKPITIIPHGVDTELFSYYERQEHEIFTFGILGYLDTVDRKGAFDVIQAFASEFSPEEKVQLVLHSSNPAFGYYRRFTDPRIITDIEQWDVEQVNEFYQQIDCFVFPSKAEGVGYPPREAMATGLPVILTDWSGLSDIAYPEICYPLQPKKLVKRPEFIHQTGNWATIDIQELMYQMRYIYEHQAEAKQKGYLASVYMRKRFTWEKVALQLKKLLTEVSKNV